jgi:hypothetical protein
MQLHFWEIAREADTRQRLEKYSMRAVGIQTEESARFSKEAALPRRSIFHDGTALASFPEFSPYGCIRSGVAKRAATASRHRFDRLLDLLRRRRLLLEVAMVVALIFYGGNQVRR